MKTLRAAKAGMGVVYEGTDLALQRKVAIKRMRGDFRQGSAFTEAFLSEARLALPEALHLLGQVAAGLDHAHSKNVIHRDLKPGNILISNEGTAKITDFGIAHRARTPDPHLTQASASGTPPYMPPEQEMGSVSLESDVYALAVMAYELLTGGLPFPGPDFTAQKRSMRMSPPTARVPTLPARVNTVLSRALDARPEVRFHSGGDLILALGAEDPSQGPDSGLMTPPA
ncbi:MAG: serine/threonine protein kinase [Elusimicrobia bacterium]|nr:serine/threonine protein kinase [Elusimicrobiota bacterium]